MSEPLKERLQTILGYCNDLSYALLARNGNLSVPLKRAIVLRERYLQLVFSISQEKPVPFR